MTQLKVFVSVLDVNDNPPRFPYETKVWEVPEVSGRGRWPVPSGASGGQGLSLGVRVVGHVEARVSAWGSG